MNTEIDLDSVALNPNPVTTAIGAAAAMTPIGVNQDHSTGLPITTSPMIEAPALTAAIMTHPTAGTPLTGMPPTMTADLTIDLENTTTNRPKDLHHLHTWHHGNLRRGNINRSPLMTHNWITLLLMMI